MPNNNQSEEVERMAEDVYQKFLKHTKDRTRAYLDNHNNPAGHEWFVGLISEALTTHGASEYARGKSEEKKRVLEMVIKKGKAYMVPTGAGSQSEGEWSIGFKQGVYEMIMWANETLEKEALSQENTLKE